MTRVSIANTRTTTLLNLRSSTYIGTFLWQHLRRKCVYVTCSQRRGGAQQIDSTDKVWSVCGNHLRIHLFLDCKSSTLCHSSMPSTRSPPSLLPTKRTSTCQIFCKRRTQAPLQIVTAKSFDDCFIHGKHDSSTEHKSGQSRSGLKIKQESFPPHKVSCLL